MDFYFNHHTLEVIFAAFLWLLFALAPLGVMTLICYTGIILPLRRQERARFFLDLLETGLREGRGVEDTIISISRSRDASVGVNFHLLAAHLEKGLPLPVALDLVPGLLPPQVTAMLKAGLKLGDLRRALPACRQMLKDGASQTRSAINYLVVLAFVVTPAIIYVLSVLEINVLPKYLDVAENMGVAAPALITFLVGHKLVLLLLQVLVLLFVWALAILYVGGPRVQAWVEDFLPFANRLISALPWRRKRMQRNFCAMFAILLDAGVPESEALTLAADCAGNELFRQRAARALAGLKQGMKLPEAVQFLDDSAEFRWRLTHALGMERGFVKAISGWNESLDAKAYQQEQAASQLVTTGLVVLNGIFIGFIVVGVFSVIIGIINEGLLW